MKNTEFFKEVMYRFKVEMASLREIENEKEIGVINLNCLIYKQKIEKTCDELISNFHQIIPELISKRANKMLQEIKDNYDRVVMTPLTVK